MLGDDSKGLASNKDMIYFLYTTLSENIGDGSFNIEDSSVYKGGIIVYRITNYGVMSDVSYTLRVENNQIILTVNEEVAEATKYHKELTRYGLDEIDKVVKDIHTINTQHSSEFNKAERAMRRRRDNVEYVFDRERIAKKKQEELDKLNRSKVFGYFKEYTFDVDNEALYPKDTDIADSDYVEVVKEEDYWGVIDLFKEFQPQEGAKEMEISQFKAYIKRFIKKADDGESINDVIPYRSTFGLLIQVAEGNRVIK